MLPTELAADILELAFDHPIVDLQVLKKLVLVSICKQRMASPWLSIACTGCTPQQAVSVHAQEISKVLGVAQPETCLLLVQMACTCRKLAMAVPLVLERRPMFDLWPRTGCHMPCMSSPLMLKWAPHVKQAFLSGQCTEHPGVRAFFSAATCLRLATLIHPDQYMHEGVPIRSTSSTLYCCETVNEELADQLCEAADSCLKAPMPHLLHLSLSEQLDALLQILSCMPNLKGLLLQTVGMTELQSCVVLPPQVVLHVQMMITSHSPLALGWLRLQRSSTISMHAVLSQQTASQSQQAVSELQTLRIHVLHIHTRYFHFSREVQLIWSQLTCCRYIHLAFDGGQGALHALPACESALISGPRPTAAQPVQDLFRASWLAVGNRSGKLYVSLDKTQQLRVEGHAEPLSSCREPWQLLILSAAGVQGLPPSRTTQEAYFLQNTAADSAGWQGIVARQRLFHCPCAFLC